MHRLATTPGGWQNDTSALILIDQTPGDIIILTAADTDIQSIARVPLPEGFPSLRVVNLLFLQQEMAIDIYAEKVLMQAKVVLLRLLGGVSYWSYGLEVCKALPERISRIILPGEEGLDANLMSHSNVPLSVVTQVWQYFHEGGVANIAACLSYLSDRFWGTTYHPPLPQRISRTGIYKIYKKEKIESDVPSVGILFYRAHYLSGNVAVIDSLIDAFIERHLSITALYVTSLQDAETTEALREHFQGRIDILLNTTSFSLLKSDRSSAEHIWQQLDVPILQVICSSSSYEEWEKHAIGLSPKDIAMHVALPEVDGRIITRAVSCKARDRHDRGLETDIVTYRPIPDRITFVADLTKQWLGLRYRVAKEKKIALILANYPTRNGRIANGVGLDTPASCIEILQALQAEGYQISDLPKTGGALIERLLAGVTNDPESFAQKHFHTLSQEVYVQFYRSLPSIVQTAMENRWGPPPETDIPIPGILLGNIFVGIQPARGYDRDPSLNYHAPDLEPPHTYFAFYLWLKEVFGANALVHVGKHGNLEWLPGKGIALSENCFPEAMMGALPNFYPFIVNDPGEGTQAKRRTQAVILDHLTPPLTRADTYEELAQLEALLEELYTARDLDPQRVPVIQEKMIRLIESSHLHLELPQVENAQLLAALDTYLCELKERQIRDGLHILGQCPQGTQLRDLLIALTRSQQGGMPGLTQQLAQTWGLPFDPLSAEGGEPYTDLPPGLQTYLPHSCRRIGHAITALENVAIEVVTNFLQQPDRETIYPQLKIAYQKLQQTPQEITNLLAGLAGKYVDSGPGGAPTRGRLEVLPTGRNFYSVDVRSIPTPTAWDLGQRAADRVIEAYIQEKGEYPTSLGLSVWGTSTMRTGGEDIAEALALLGVQPCWDGTRVVDFAILPLAILGRPRVDVTLRISGFFRDSFAHLIHLFQAAATAVMALEEPPDQNPLPQRVQQDQRQGLSPQEAQYRVFGAKPGAYGAGLQGLIESQNWENDGDLARAYLNWSSYAYINAGEGVTAPQAFAQRLTQLEIVLHNQDNREHDILDSDDYYQFQGGMTVAVRSLTGKNPATLFGDHSRPENPQVRSLAKEIHRVYRSRVINPKWIAGVMRHGYKGACEMAATLDYLFAYDATAQVGAGYMYEGIAHAYILAAPVQEFLRQHNPWALRDMAERLLEAEQRGLWQAVPLPLSEALRSVVLLAESEVERRS